MKLFAHFGNPWWSWILSPALAVAVTFFALHLLAIAAATASISVRKIAGTSEKSETSLTLRLSLICLTAFAVSQIAGGGISAFAFAAPWLLWAVTNLVAWLVLLLTSLTGALAKL